MKQQRWFFLLSLLALLLLAAVPALAETTASYDLSWWTVDGGGASSLTAGSYTLSGTAGQPDAGSLSSSDYDLGGGFWQVLITRLNTFLPLIRK